MTNSIVPAIENSANGLVVTSETIAQGAGVEHRAVLQLISKHQAKIERFGQVAFEMRAGYNNAQVRVALLNEHQSTFLLTMMRNTEQVLEFKANLVEAFFNMAEQLSKPAPLTEDQIVAQALQITSAKVKELEAKVKQDAPKVDYVNTFVADDDLISFRTLASDLNVGERDLRDALIYTGWIYGQTRSRWSNTKEKLINVTRYSAMADKKQYFHAKQNHDVPRFGDEVMHTLKVTAPGAQAVQRHIARIVGKYGPLSSAVIELERIYNEKKVAA